MCGALRERMEEGIESEIEEEKSLLNEQR